MLENQLIEALLTGKPYFGPAMRAMQGSPVRYRYLSTLVTVLSRLKQEGSIHVLEIGSWAGASAITWATAIQNLHREGKVTCVDQWRPYFAEELETSPHYRTMNEAAKHEKIFNLFLHNIRSANVSHMIDYVIGDARKVLSKLSSTAYDIVYIDGSHVYESVRADIQEAKRLVRDGGFICGDDLELQRVKIDEGEHRVAVDSKKDFVYSTKQEGFYHPGVTEAVAVEFGDVSSWEGVWATRKIGAQWARVQMDVALAQIPSPIENASPSDDVGEIGETRDYWLFTVGNKFFATAKSLGSPSVLIELLHDGQLPPVLFTGDNLDEVRSNAVESEQERRLLAEPVGMTDQFNLMKTRERFVAVAKRLGVTDLFTERLGERELDSLIFFGGTLEDAREKALAFERQSAAPEVELIAELGRYSIVRAGDHFLAIAKELGPVNLFQERVGERHLPPILLRGSSFEEVRKQALEEECRTARPACEMVGETAAYNLVRMGKRFVAVAKQLGPTDLFAERLGERDLASLLFLGESLGEVREKALELERQIVARDVELIDEIGRYNIVRAGERFLAVAKDLGPINLFREQVGERELPPLLLIDINLVALRQRIAQLITKAAQHQDDS